MEKLEETIKALKAISDPGRIRILSVLINKHDLCVCEIRDIIGLSQPSISSHLKILENAGLIQSFKDGKWVNYRLNDKLDSSIKDFLLKIISIIDDSSIIISDNKKSLKVNRLAIKK